MLANSELIAYLLVNQFHHLYHHKAFCKFLAAEQNFKIALNN